VRWPFGRRPRGAIDILEGANWTCRCCNEPHQGMFDLGALVPNVWPNAWEYEPNGALRLDGFFLSEDFCVLGGQDFLVRSVLDIPVHGMADSFGYGVWCSLKKENFVDYVDHFNSGYPDDTEPWWSWLCNMAQPYYDGTEPLGGHLHPRPGNLRPLFRAGDQSHPLGVAQREGISPEAVLKIYEAYGHVPAA
jgi:hypothetical protein